MSLYKYLNRIERLDALIRRKGTGTPEELADKLGISERWLYKLLRELKEEMDCPIVYDRHKHSYKYKVSGKIVVGFQKNLTKKEKNRTRGGFCNKSESLYLFVQWQCFY